MLSAQAERSAPSTRSPQASGLEHPAQGRASFTQSSDSNPHLFWKHPKTHLEIVWDLLPGTLSPIKLTHEASPHKCVPLALTPGCQLPPAHGEALPSFLFFRKTRPVLQLHDISEPRLENLPKKGE